MDRFLPATTPSNDADVEALNAEIAALELLDEDAVIEEVVSDETPDDEASDDETIEEPIVSQIRGNKAETIIIDEFSFEELEMAPSSEDGADLSDEDLKDIGLEIAKHEAYASQEVTTGGVETVAAAAGAPKEKSKTASEPRKPRDLSSLPNEAFILTNGAAPEDLAANKAAVIAAMPAIKKVAEKYENVLSCLSVGKLPSVYVVSCFKLLREKGTVHSVDLVAQLKAQKYSDGTARSQVGQIMALFPLLKIAERSGQTLTINPNSKLASQMITLLDEKSV